MKPTEAEVLKVIEQCAHGNRAALKCLFEWYYKDVIRIIHKLCPNPTWGEDLAQVAFEEILKSLKSFQGRCQFSTWIYRICHNVYVNYCQQNRFQKLFQGITLKEHEVVNGHQPDKHYESTVIINQVYKVLSTLKPQFREAFILSEFEELSGKEIAEIMNIPLASVWVYIHRAREALFEKLGHLR